MDFKLLKELSCAICFENFDDQGRCPRILLCGHTFCHAYLQKMFSDSSLCPTCKTSFNYTSVDLIPVNFLAKSLLSVKKELLVAKFSASNLMKENCSEPQMKKLRCLDCRAWACSQSEALIHEHCQTVHTAEDCEDIKLKVFEKADQERSIRESTIMTLDDILEGLNKSVIDLQAMKLRENEFLEKLQQYRSLVEESSDDDSFITAMAKLEQLLRSGQKIHLKCLPEAAHIKQQILMSVCSKEACCLAINQGTDNARKPNNVYSLCLQLMNPSQSGLQPSSHEFQTPFNCGSSIGRWELKYGASDLCIDWTRSTYDLSNLGLIITGQNELTRYSGGGIKVLDHGWII